MKSWWLALVVLLLVGCGGVPAGPTPTPLPPTHTPLLRTAAPDPNTLLPSQVPPAETPFPTFTPLATAWFMAPAGTGLSPAEAQLFRPVDSQNPAPSDWRPPPMVVPLSIIPDDHYWLIRPIPSGRRNYDLEWYPFGNDVLLSQFYPYRIHHGLDFPNPTGTPILAASSGTVVYAGPLYSNRDGLNYYGNTIIIEHDWQWQGQAVFTLYAHTLEMFVNVDDYVQQGQLIAGVGSSGEVSGPHLHLEVRIGNNNYYEARNPALWIAPFEGWGTLAGRVVDRDGRFITNALVTVTPLNVNTPVRSQYTYLYDGVKPDNVWQENFVVGDLPAGRYRVEIEAQGVLFRHTVDVLPGRTNYLIVATNFDFIPTETPTPTPTLAATATLSVTLPISPTATLTPSP